MTKAEFLKKWWKVIKLDKTFSRQEAKPGYSYPDRHKDRWLEVERIMSVHASAYFGVLLHADWNSPYLSFEYAMNRGDPNILELDATDPMVFEPHEDVLKEAKEHFDGLPPEIRAEAAAKYQEPVVRLLCGKKSRAGSKNKGS